ncbi:flagellar basal body P-ring protein FlgI [Malikia spinosa]|uniref:Flagellar P-ring protein n=1 Tax=Malikia spinosa TaxID=86180 RepID=A0A7C9IZ05_9BURK|nr:flagellar basal body P-ring protein FlgI [Malikia spinosa]MYZ52867.1 flagellar basal body P-ring protein FlgI [Malikia spinosa]
MSLPTLSSLPGLRRGLFVLCLLLAGPTQAERIKDLATLQGVRYNPLLGYGLVVGLDGTGDQSPFTVQAVVNMLQQMGMTLPPGVNLQAKNVAGVMVTTSLPAFVQTGQSLDVTVSSMGSAKSLRGGTLLMTPLKGADGQVYALAQGNVLVSGAGAAAAGAKAQVNHLNVGRISGGATVERSVPTELGQGDTVTLELKDSDFGTASRVVEALNRRFGPATATAQNGRVIQVQAPQQQDQRVAFLGALEALEVTPSQQAPKVVLNGRTGSIVMNQAVTLEACAVAHGNLSIVIGSSAEVSQPAPLSQGQTVVTTRTNIEIKQEPGQLMLLPRAVLLADVVKALNAIGATPQDLLAILQAMKAAGALRAELEVI